MNRQEDEEYPPVLKLHLAKEVNMAHEHGLHKCYCPNCNFEVEADAYVKCNTLICPACGTRMRAEETGEFHIEKEIAQEEPTPSPLVQVIAAVAFIGFIIALPTIVEKLGK